MFVCGDPVWRKRSAELGLGSVADIREQGALGQARRASLSVVGTPSRVSIRASTSLEITSESTSTPSQSEMTN